MVFPNLLVTVSSAGGGLSQSEGTALTLRGSSIFNASNLGHPAAVILAGSDNDFSGTVSASGSDVTLTDRNALTLGLVTAMKMCGEEQTISAVVRLVG